MKTISSFVVILFFGINTSIYSQDASSTKENKFIGTYDGLNEDIEFEFQATDGKIYTFQEIADGVTIDLYDEENFTKNYEVTWIKQTVEALDDDGEPTGETEDIQVIVLLKEI